MLASVESANQSTQSRTSAGGTFSVSMRLLVRIARTIGPQRAVVANSEHLRQACFRLIHDEYLARGLCAANAEGSYCTPYARKEGSRTFALPVRGVLGGTVTLIPDDGGLPLESLYAQEVRERREQGARLAEVSMLALNSRLFPRSQYSMRSIHKMRALFSLFAAMHSYCVRCTDVTELVVVVHPRHEGIYKMLRFRRCGPVRSYATVQGKPALPLVARVADISEFVTALRLKGFVDSTLLNECDYHDRILAPGSDLETTCNSIAG